MTVCISDGDVNKLPDRECEKPSLLMRLFRWVCGVETEPEKEQRLARDAQDRLDQVSYRLLLLESDINCYKVVLLLKYFSPCQLIYVAEDLCFKVYHFQVYSSNTG